MVEALKRLIFAKWHEIAGVDFPEQTIIPVETDNPVHSLEKTFDAGDLRSKCFGIEFSTALSLIW